ITYALFLSRFSPPEMWIRQGLTLARMRPSLRNQRPVRSRRGSTSNSLIVANSGTQSRIRAAVAAQIQADRSRRVILNNSADQILALSTIRSKSSPLSEPGRCRLERYEDQYVGAGGDGGGGGRLQLAAVSRPFRQRRGDRFPAGRMECGIGEKHPLEERQTPAPGHSTPHHLLPCEALRCSPR